MEFSGVGNVRCFEWSDFQTHAIDEYLRRVQGGLPADGQVSVQQFP